jgi:serine/threonine-protein phosphatase 2B regulatory subunit
MEADQDGDGKLSFEEFAMTVSNTVCLFCLPHFIHALIGNMQDIVKQMTLEDLF